MLRAGTISLRNLSLAQAHLGHDATSLPLRYLMTSAAFPRVKRSSQPISTLSRTALRFSDEVHSALESKKPLVALESTIISHGMPYPQNYETAVEVEKIVRDNGAVPATIAIIDGQIQIGLSQDQIRILAKLGRSAVKASRRDLAVVLAKKQTGATTVSATMLLAHRAGISVFATGGIGGVHRGYENTMDASADLTELGRTPVAVVCAGVKSILDIGRTLEFLETQGVTVATFGNTSDFPAFFTRTSGFKSMLNVKTPREAAEIIAANHAIDLQSGIVFGVPIPEVDAMDDALVGKAIDIAVKEAHEQNIFGKESTPFLLKRVNELTGGGSLKSNIALVKQNVSVAARIAKDLSTLKAHSVGQTRSFSTSSRYMRRNESIQRPTMVIGGAVVDITATAHNTMLDSMLNSSFPGVTRISLGGVGRNVAEGISRLDPSGCVFVSAVGGATIHWSKKEDSDGPIARLEATDDLFGSWLIQELGHRGQHKHEIITVPGSRTATYTALHDATGNLLSAVADMDVFELLPSVKVKEAIIKHNPKVVCFDANLSVECIRTILETCHKCDIKTFFEPTSVAKCIRPLHLSMFDTLLDGALRFASPNEYELQEMAASARNLINENQNYAPFRRLSQKPIRKPEGIKNTVYPGFLLDAFYVLQFIPTLFVKLGAKGVIVFQRQDSQLDRASKELEDWSTRTINTRSFPSLKVQDIKSVTGAGDSFVASVVTSLSNLDRFQPEISSGLVTSHDEVLWAHIEQIVEDGQIAATLTMQTHETVAHALGMSRQARRLQALTSK
ncbi:Indigoidine synthase A like protein-domain-containing protein [Lobosporangium transversale]|uniref:Indigoidine synthase A like protein-domain-containing protein n=1 Tax=Lobosporangium transversale TaxID=64571 RepID=A0A1Y2GHU2_9FUNG|nr:Indigoidine synthase A like protein-domain-containing protein [Lobosporangium transversale]ORZ11350.1 Indigoidine synthase A like protein-domain-containing protein [Lobosporangium transversale]|eukprot:XP_021879665.1 Indigoidine synthase A like protein-domain-containing protein [Lobosporangium transversale]